MTVGELRATLEAFDEKLQVVLTTISEVKDSEGESLDSHVESWELESISNGWIPAGILSLESTTCIIS